jgi:hypothetical protein
MASRSLLTAEAAHARRTADTQKATEVARRFTGWSVWSSRDGKARVATRTGNQAPPDGDDSTWTQTVIADTWTDLELQLAEQTHLDAERTYDAAS